jgi:hypothetical protein
LEPSDRAFGYSYSLQELSFPNISPSSLDLDDITFILIEVPPCNHAASSGLHTRKAANKSTDADLQVRAVCSLDGDCCIDNPITSINKIGAVVSEKQTMNAFVYGLTENMKAICALNYPCRAFRN